MSRSVYVIKPEAMTDREEIRRLIGNAGLEIVASRIVVLGEAAVQALYPEIGGALRSLTVHYYGLGPSEVGVVEGTDAVRRLLQLRGSAVAPQDCEVDTVRARFGKRQPIRLAETEYYLNGFHCSKDVDEAISQLELFAKLTATEF